MHLNQQNRLSFYFDLHAHNAKKGCFIYGNAINDFVEQVESQVFCKLISMNNKGFQYEYCNFTQKHMNMKDIKKREVDTVEFSYPKLGFQQDTNNTPAAQR